LLRGNFIVPSVSFFKFEEEKIDEQIEVLCRFVARGFRGDVCPGEPRASNQLSVVRLGR
jgi:hypothetical protein